MYKNTHYRKYILLYDNRFSSDGRQSLSNDIRKFWSFKVELLIFYAFWLFLSWMGCKIGDNITDIKNSQIAV